MKNLNKRMAAEIAEKIKEEEYKGDFNNGECILIRRRNGGETSLSHFKNIKNKHMILRRKIGIELINLFLKYKGNLTKKQFELFAKNRGITVAVANILKQDLNCFTTEVGRNKHPKRVNEQLDKIFFGIETMKRNHQARKENEN